MKWSTEHCFPHLSKYFSIAHVTRQRGYIFKHPRWQPTAARSPSTGCHLVTASGTMFAPSLLKGAGGPSRIGPTCAETTLPTNFKASASHPGPSPL